MPSQGQDYSPAYQPKATSTHISQLLWLRDGQTGVPGWLWLRVAPQTADIGGHRSCGHFKDCLWGQPPRSPLKLTVTQDGLHAFRHSLRPAPWGGTAWWPIWWPGDRGGASLPIICITSVTPVTPRVGTADSREQQMVSEEPQ